MTLTELRYIIALQECGHFGRAAERCHVSQPTLSVAVKKLEDELGIAIFERGRNRITATPAGEKIIQQAGVVLKASEQLREIADVGKDPLGSKLSIGAIHTVGPYLFPAFIPSLRQLAPEMPLYVEENFTAVLRRSLVAGQLDAIIVARPFTEPEVVTQTLYEERFEVLLYAEHPLAKRKTIPSELLAEEPVLLLGEGHCFRDQVLSCCPDIKRAVNDRSQLQSVVEGSSLETLKHMVASKLGITVLPASAANVANYGDRALVTRPLRDPAAVRTVALAWRSSFPRHQVIDVLVKAIRRALKSR